ncbi:MAG: response regulator transcription factor [Saprospiraceae bacterium]
MFTFAIHLFIKKSMPIRTLLYDHNTGFREALTDLIGENEGYELCAAFDNCIHVVEQAAALQPDVELMDIDMPCMTGIEGVARLKKAYPHFEALMLTVFDDSNFVTRPNVPVRNVRETVKDVKSITS